MLTNPDLFPTEEVIFSCIHEKQKLWINLFDELHKHYPDFTEEWRYYKDGKSWLLKILRKKKTVCWVSLIGNGFRATFYFSDKFEDAIYTSSISEALKEEFKNGKHYGKIRGLTIVFGDENDIEYAKVLIKINLLK